MTGRHLTASLAAGLTLWAVSITAAIVTIRSIT